MITLASTPRSRTRTVATTVAGNFIEFFDWLIFGLYAPILARHFFPAGDQLAAVLAVFSAYATGMFFRPLGGILAGVLADRRGRRVALLLSITLMGGGSLLIGLLPGYASIGIAAPILLFLARAAQGLSAGGEWPAAVSYLMELAPRNRRCLYGSYFAVSSAAGGLAAAVLGLGLGAFFGSGAMAQWAWRVPFLVGAILSVVLLLLRRQLAESEAFARARRTAPRAGLRRLLREHPKAVGLAALFVAGVTINTTTWTTVAPALAQTRLHADPAVVYAAVSASIALAMLVQIPFGLLADRIGVLPMLGASLLGFAVAGPVALATMAPGIGRLVLSMGTGLVLMACLTSVMPKLMAALFPIDLRASGIGLPHGIASSLAGGLTPWLGTYLAGHDRFGWYLGLLAAAAALAWAAGWIAVRRMPAQFADRATAAAPRGAPLVGTSAGRDG